MLKNYSPSTQKSYVSAVAQFAQYYHQCPSLLGKPEIEQYLLYLKEEKGNSISSVHLAMNGLKFLYTQVLQRDWESFQIPRPKTPKRLPVVLSREEVSILISSIKNLKQRTLVTLLYATGLRLSEGLHLQLRDINSARRQLIVRQGKGKKDRYVPISEQLLLCLQNYWRVYRPKEWLFEGASPDKPYSQSSVQQIMKRARVNTGLNKPISAHSLRHSFATGSTLRHMLESGMGIYQLKTMLGHSCLQTTSRYIHIQQQSIVVPIDPLLF